MCTALFPTKVAAGGNCPCLLIWYPILTPPTPSQPVPSHPIPTQPIASHPNSTPPIPPHPIPPHTIPLNPISSYPNPSCGSPSPGHIGQQPTMLGDPEGHSGPTPDVVPAPRKGSTAAFLGGGEVLQGEPGFDPTWHSSHQVYTKNFCFPVPKRASSWSFLCRA